MGYVRTSCLSTSFQHPGEVQAALVEEWNEIQQEYIRTIILSMPARMQAVIEARGGNTSY